MGGKITVYVQDKSVLQPFSQKFLITWRNPQAIRSSTKAGLKIYVKCYFSKEDTQMAKQVQDKIFNITNHQGNANQSYNEITPHWGLTPVRMAIITDKK